MNTISKNVETVSVDELSSVTGGFSWKQANEAGKVNTDRNAKIGMYAIGGGGLAYCGARYTMVGGALCGWAGAVVGGALGGGGTYAYQFGKNAIGQLRRQ
jgi:hypothetical protein